MPVTASVFAIEALCGFNNVLSVIIAVTVAFLVVEMFEGADFTDTVIESNVRAYKKGKTVAIVDVPLTAKKDSFVVGMQLRDILWPNSCFVVSIERAAVHHGNHEIREGDVITLHYKTYNPKATAEELKILMGEQSEEIEKIMILN